MLTKIERIEARAARMQEKLGRMPLNDISLKVQDGTIDLKDVLSVIESKFDLKTVAKTTEDLEVENG